MLDPGERPESVEVVAAVGDVDEASRWSRDSCELRERVPGPGRRGRASTARRRRRGSPRRKGGGVGRRRRRRARDQADVGYRGRRVEGEHPLTELGADALRVPAAPAPESRIRRAAAAAGRSRRGPGDPPGPGGAPRLAVVRYWSRTRVGAQRVTRRSPRGGGGLGTDRSRWWAEPRAHCSRWRGRGPGPPCGLGNPGRGTRSVSGTSRGPTSEGNPLPRRDKGPKGPCGLRGLGGPDPLRDRLAEAARTRLDVALGREGHAAIMGVVVEGHPGLQLGRGLTGSLAPLVNGPGAGVEGDDPSGRLGGGSRSSGTRRRSCSR